MQTRKKRKVGGGGGEAYNNKNATKPVFTKNWRGINDGRT